MLMRTGARYLYMCIKERGLLYCKTRSIVVKLRCKDARGMVNVRMIQLIPDLIDGHKVR